MAYMTTIADVFKNRPFKPRYARTQATAQAVVIADADAASINPGVVLMRTGAAATTEGTGTVSIFKAASNTVPAGICGTFAKELEITNSKDVAMWVLGSDAIFACSNFDTTASWSTAITNLAAGKEVYLTATNAGLLTLEGDSAVAAQRVARLIGVEAGTADAPATILIAGCL